MNFQEFTLIGRLTRDAETKTFDNGGKVTKISVAINERKLNKKTNEWEDFPVYWDVKGFNNKSQQLADHLEKLFGQNGKGRLVYVKGRLKKEEWADRQTGEHREKWVVEAIMIMPLDAKPKEGSATASAKSEKSPVSVGTRTVELPNDQGDSDESQNDDSEIPF